MAIFRGYVGGLSWVRIACAAGLVHAGFSLYWAMGGQWLLGTVGQWAVELSVEAPLAAGLGLGVVALLKAAAAILPVAVAYHLLPWRRFWRAVSWVGAVVLVVYGGINTVISNAVLTGLIRPATGYDRHAMIGHAWLWDPLFLAWGIGLLVHLWLSRPTRAREHDVAPRAAGVQYRAAAAPVRRRD